MLPENIRYRTAGGELILVSEADLMYFKVIGQLYTDGIIPLRDAIIFEAFGILHGYTDIEKKSTKTLTKEKHEHRT